MFSKRNLWIAALTGLLVAGGVLFALFHEPAYQDVWVHNPYSQAVRLVRDGHAPEILEPWAFEQVPLQAGIHHFEVLASTGEAVLDHAEVVIPPPTPSAILYSIGAAGCYRVTFQAPSEGKLVSRIVSSQQILHPGLLDEPALAQDSQSQEMSRKFQDLRQVALESIPTQLLVIAEQACQSANWSNALRTARQAQQVFLPLPDDVFYATACTLEARALLGMKRPDAALEVIDKLLQTPELGVDSMCLAQNFLMNLLPSRQLVEKFENRYTLSPTLENRLLLARIVHDPTQAHTFMLEAMASRELSHLGGQMLLQRMLWEGKIQEARDLSRSMEASTMGQPSSDFETLAHLWLREATPEGLWSLAARLPMQLSEPIDSVPWLAGAAARLGDATRACRLLKEVQWPESMQDRPSELYWKCAVLLSQGAGNAARKAFDSAPDRSSIWDAAANLDTALADLPPNHALRVFETQFRTPNPLLEPYRLAWYRLARECGLDEIARQVLSVYSKEEAGTTRRVLWEILEGGDWQPEKLLLFAVSHSIQETNDVLYASALRGQLDGDHSRARGFLEQCCRYPPAFDFPFVAARRELDLYQNR